MKNKGKLTILAGMLILAMAQTSQAGWDPVSARLDVLRNNQGNDNGKLVIGDKTFSMFDYKALNLTDFSASQITVTAWEKNGVYFLTWDGTMKFVGGPGTAGDLSLWYTVTAAAPWKISKIDQCYQGTSTAGGDLRIDETVDAYLDGDMVTVAHSHLDLGDHVDYPGETPENPADQLIIKPPQSELSVFKDIQFGFPKDSNGGEITITKITQSFHQVPEPTTLIAGACMLLPFAASTIRVLRRKNR